MRLIWLAHRKNRGEAGCLLAKLPLDLIRKIAQHSTTVIMEEEEEEEVVVVKEKEVNSTQQLEEERDIPVTLL